MVQAGTIPSMTDWRTMAMAKYTGFNETKNCIVGEKRSVR